MIYLELPYPPSVNHYKKVGAIKTTRNGKKYQLKYNSNKTKEYYLEIGRIWHGMKMVSNAKSYPEIARLRLRVDVHAPDHRKRDIDNILKVLLDALTRCVIIHDDSQIDELLVSRAGVIKKGLVKIYLDSI